MKYGWNKKDLLKVKSKLISIIEAEEDNEKRKYMSSILANIEEYIQFDNSNKGNYGVDFNEELADIQDDITIYEGYYSLVSRFFNHVTPFREQIYTIEDRLESVIKLDQSFGKISKIRISNDRAFSLVNQFYKNYFPNLYPTFSQAYDQRFSSVRFVRSVSKKSVANSIYFDVVRRYFLNITRTSDLSKLYNLIHEYGHITSAIINPIPRNSESIFFTEVESFFPEMVSRYENIGNFDINHVLFECYTTLVNFLEASTNIQLHNPLVNLWNECGKKVDKTFFNAADEYYDSDKYMIGKILDTKIYDDGDYIISYMIAIELLQIYKKDKKLALEIFEEIIKFPNPDELQYFIESKLNLGSHLKEYTSELLDNFSLNLRKAGIGRV